MSRFWCQKGHFTEGSKTCFTHISFKLTLYKNRYVYKLCASGGTVTRYWAFVDIAKHVPRDFEYFYRGGWGGLVMCRFFVHICVCFSARVYLFVIVDVYNRLFCGSHGGGLFHFNVQKLS